MKAICKINQLSAPEQVAIQSFVTKLQRQLPEKTLSIILYGSRARGEAQPDSDIDLAILISQEDRQLVSAIRDIAADVSLEAGLYLSTRVWSMAHWQHLAKLQTGLYRNIQAEGIPLAL